MCDLGHYFHPNDEDVFLCTFRLQMGSLLEQARVGVLLSAQ